MEGRKGDVRSPKKPILYLQSFQTKNFEGRIINNYEGLNMGIMREELRENSKKFKGPQGQTTLIKIKRCLLHAFFPHILSQV